MSVFINMPVKCISERCAHCRFLEIENLREEYNFGWENKPLSASNHLQCARVSACDLILEEMKNDPFIKLEKDEK